MYSAADSVIERQKSSTGDTYLQGVASFDKAHLMAHGIEESDIVSETVRTLPLSDVLKEHRLKKLDALVIDVEGAERAVFDTLPLERTRPATVIYEGIHLSPDDDASIEHRLVTAGYEVIKGDPDYIAVDKRGVLAAAADLFQTAKQDWPIMRDPSQVWK